MDLETDQIEWLALSQHSAFTVIVEGISEVMLLKLEDLTKEVNPQVSDQDYDDIGINASNALNDLISQYLFRLYTSADVRRILTAHDTD